MSKNFTHKVLRKNFYFFFVFISFQSPKNGDCTIVLCLKFTHFCFLIKKNKFSTHLCLCEPTVSNSTVLNWFVVVVAGIGRHLLHAFSRYRQQHHFFMISYACLKRMPRGCYELDGACCVAAVVLMTFWLFVGAQTLIFQL